MDVPKKKVVPSNLHVKPRKTKKKDTLVDIPSYIPKTTGPEKKKPAGAEALSQEDRDYIEAHARKYTVEHIADNIGKRRSTVFRYMEKHGLLGDEDKRDSRIKRAILNDLHNYPFWKVITQAYTEEEIEYFEEEWYSFIVQLDDNIEASERMELRKLIENQIRLDRLAIKEQQINNDIRQLDMEIQHLQGKLESAFTDEDEVEKLQREITGLLAQQSALAIGKTNTSREMSDLQKTQSNQMKDLDITRARRVEKFDVSDKTWARMLIEIKETPRLKQQLDAYGYISFLATQRMKGRLTRDHTYADGLVQPPMLLPEGAINQELAGMVEELFVPKEG
jgi:hypothetical protein